MVAMFENFVCVIQEDDIPQVIAALRSTFPQKRHSYASAVCEAGWHFSVWPCPSQVRSDWYVYAVLSSLPWVGKELYEKKDVEVDRLLSQIDGYLKYVLFTSYFF